jgi:hypothetical protein
MDVIERVAVAIKKRLRLKANSVPIIANAIRDELQRVAAERAAEVATRMAVANAGLIRSGFVDPRAL